MQDREGERERRQREGGNPLRGNARRDDTASPRRVRARGDENGVQGETGEDAQGGPMGLCVIDEAVIATGLHSTPRYCQQTMHIHRPYK